MKVAEYRLLIDAVVQSFNSLRGCQLSERPREAAWVRRTMTELRAADCPRATNRDRERADYWLSAALEFLVEADLLEEVAA